MRDFSIKVVVIFIILTGLFLTGDFWSHIDVHGLLKHIFDPSGNID